jgi:hypothetical protein
MFQKSVTISHFKVQVQVAIIIVIVIIITIGDRRTPIEAPIGANGARHHLKRDGWHNGRAK